MLIDTKKIHKDEAYQADVCILGGGVAGIVLANELIKSKMNVILLESGEERYSKETQDLYKAESKSDNFPDPLYSRLRFLGGSSNHWENSVERFDPIDFKKREWVSHSGWPVEYKDVARYYPEAEVYCGVGDEGFNLAYWKDKLNFSDALSNSKFIDTTIAKSSLPATRFFLKYGSALVQSKNIRVFKNANVTDITYDKDSQSVKSVIFSSTPGRQHKVNSKVFIMSLGGIENARMLLTFNEKYNGSLGNKFDNVGRFFMEHPTIRAAHLHPFNNAIGRIYDGITDGSTHITGRFKLNEFAQTKYRVNNLRLFLSKQSKIDLSQGVSSTHILSDSLSKAELPDNFGAHIVNILEDIDMVSEALLRKTGAGSFFESADAVGGYQFISMIEQTPNRDNRITLGTKKDRFNLKKININWRITQSDIDSTWRSLGLLARDPGIQRIGRVRLLKDNESRIWGSQLGFGAHHMGTTRMSGNIRDGVVDAGLKVFGTKNLYIAGSSTFPTGGHVPPTLTIIAMTIKLASELKGIV